MSLLIRVLGIFNGPDSRLPGKFSTECFAAFVVFLPGLGSEILVRCDPEATKLRFPCPFVPEALLPRFGDICFSLGISPNAFRLIVQVLCHLSVTRFYTDLIIVMVIPYDLTKLFDRRLQKFSSAILDFGSHLGFSLAKKSLFTKTAIVS